MMKEDEISAECTSVSRVYLAAEQWQKLFLFVTVEEKPQNSSLFSRCITARVKAFHSTGWVRAFPMMPRPRDSSQVCKKTKERKKKGREKKSHCSHVKTVNLLHQWRPCQFHMRRF